jgi:hypothetical protein
VRVFSAYIKVHGLVHLAARLRCLCRETRDFFFFDFFLESSDLVERGNWKKTKFWKAFRWFCTIPPFQEDYSRFHIFLSTRCYAAFDPGVHAADVRDEAREAHVPCGVGSALVELDREASRFFPL